MLQETPGALCSTFRTRSEPFFQPFFSLMHRLKNLRNFPTTHLKQPVSNQHGFTLIELMAVIGIIGTLAAIALTNFFSFREKAKITMAISDIRGIERTILSFRIDNNRLPISLIEAGLGNPVDPWGNTYVYYPVASVPKGILRKDKSLVPINTDYDLYSGAVTERV